MTTPDIYEPSTINRQRRTNAEMESFYDAIMGIVEEQHPMTVHQVYYQAEVSSIAPFETFDTSISPPLGGFLPQ